MKFNPFTKRLYTDQNVLIKQLHCPHDMRWQSLEVIPGQPDRRCGICQSTVIATDHLSDEQVLQQVVGQPDTCLQLRIGQANIRIISQDV